MTSWVTWPLRILGFLGWYIGQWLQSNIRVAADALTPGMAAQPGVMAFETRCETDAEITLLACAVSLTPDTNTLAIQTNPNVLYCRGMYQPDREAFQRDVREMERRLLRAVRREDSKVKEGAR